MTGAMAAPPAPPASCVPPAGSAGAPAPGRLKCRSHRRRSFMKALAAAVALTALLALPAQAQKGANLQARTSGDLAELCGANPKDALGDAKINFCHGFAQ